jgi:hypothetical protein
MLSACNRAPAGETAATGAPPLTELRIAVVQPGSGCATDAPDWPAPERAYIRHLSERMAVPVQVCPVANRAEAAKAIAEKRADIGLLDPASYAPFKDALRPILTPRTPIDLGRVEVILAVSNTSAMRKLTDVGKATLLFAGSSAPRLDGPRRTLASAGLSQSNPASARILASPAEVASVLQNAPDSVGVFLSADWSRLCRGMSRQDRPCEGLRQIWRGRSQAGVAWAVRRDIPRESWVRLVGIHVALFQEAPEAARWLAPGTTEIEPTEAGALDPISGDY